MTQANVDPVNDEIREARRHISARVGRDPARLVHYYIELQQQYTERLLLPSSGAKNSTGKSAA
jgi:hypothetical protein